MQGECLDCQKMGLDRSGQRAICLKSNPGMLGKKEVDPDKQPDWCPGKE